MTGCSPRKIAIDVLDDPFERERFGIAYTVDRKSIVPVVINVYLCLLLAPHHLFLRIRDILLNAFFRIPSKPICKRIWLAYRSHAEKRIFGLTGKLLCCDRMKLYSMKFSQISSSILLIATDVFKTKLILMNRFLKKVNLKK